ncbi:hypothetical protein J8I87_35175 [Paraburkholderia sp. LEh10]|uniref:hypothetical protein n=1 Tax=Paraburkholderia sp. LEh10 TaxID=2821353 RepID=UPI001AEBA47D|nr:hypothetical protein [Paraburkholderia sp. LEh10]MBP0594816.1 hypothetical protein [Paraburkholderia sp. LEh10]
MRRNGQRRSDGGNDTRTPIRRKDRKTGHPAEIDGCAPPDTASPAAHCSFVFIAGNPLPGAVATFDYMIFFKIAPAALKRLFARHQADVRSTIPPAGLQMPWCASKQSDPNQIAYFASLIYELELHSTTYFHAR